MEAKLNRFSKKRQWFEESVEELINHEPSRYGEFSVYEGGCNDSFAEISFYASVPNMETLEQVVRKFRDKLEAAEFTKEYAELSYDYQRNEKSVVTFICNHLLFDSENFGEFMNILGDVAVNDVPVGELGTDHFCPSCGVKAVAMRDYGQEQYGCYIEVHPVPGEGPDDSFNGEHYKCKACKVEFFMGG